MSRSIGPKYVVVWGLLALLFFGVLFSGPGIGWWLAAFMLSWFGIWETLGVASSRKGDTCSELVWAVLKVRDRRPQSMALLPLVAGLFVGFALLFVGLVANADTRLMPSWATISAATSLAAGTLGFLSAHFLRGDNAGWRR